MFTLRVLAMAGLASAFTGVRTTYYETLSNDNLPAGHCSLPAGSLPAGVFGTAISTLDWATGTECGACINVHYGGKTIKAVVVDECQGCPEAGLDLFMPGFAALADTALGVIATDWEYVDCANPGPLQVLVHDGSNTSWLQLQAFNANKAINTIEISSDGNTWYPTTRQTYNFFTAGTIPDSTLFVRVTSDANDVVVIQGVDVSGGTYNAGNNF